MGMFFRRPPVVRPGGSTRLNVESKKKVKSKKENKFRSVESKEYINDTRSTTIHFIIRKVRLAEADQEIGVGYELTGRYKEAIRSYSEAGSIASRLNRGLLYVQMQKYEEAITDFAFVIEACRDCGQSVDGEVLTGLGLALQGAGRLGDAEQVLAAASEVDNYWEATRCIHSVISQEDDSSSKEEETIAALKKVQSPKAIEISRLPDKPLTYEEAMAAFATSQPIPRRPRPPIKVDDYESEQSLPATVSILPPPPPAFKSAADHHSECSQSQDLEACSPEPEQLEVLASIPLNTSFFAKGFQYLHKGRSSSARKDSPSGKQARERPTTPSLPQFLPLVSIYNDFAPSNNDIAGNTCSLPTNHSPLPRKSQDNSQPQKRALSFSAAATPAVLI